MNRITIIVAILFNFVSIAQQKNTLLETSFWKKNPDLATVQAEIATGNNPSEFNPSAFDPVALAINNGVSNQVVYYLLQQKGNEINKLTHDERTYLHWAAAKGNIELVEYLINIGANINQEDSHNTTPLVYALTSGNASVQLFETFLKAGLDPKKKYKDKATLLMLAVPYDKDLAITQFLETKGLSIKDQDALGKTVFDYAARTGNITNLKKLIEKGSKFTSNALLIAAEGTRRSSNSLEVYQYLIEDLKLKPTITTSNDETLFHLIAKKENQTPIAEYLFNKGVLLNTVDKEGNTVLHKVAGTRDLAFTKFILEKGIVDVNKINQKGESALMQAIKTGLLETMNKLVKNGADINLLDKERQGLVYHLVQNYRAPRNGNDDFLDKLRWLRDNGMNLKKPLLKGHTLYHIAVVKNNLEYLKKLEGFGIDINAKNEEGLTALHKAVMVAKDENIINYLLTQGADKNIKTDLEESVYSLARENEVLAKKQINLEFLK
ncbi:ankyrin repeat domain-containing protein [Flavobacterium columnare]|uniref:Ankyrin repeat domain-containing protein n=2 Tax=Flavobacterium TaxID=237 RepID=A0A2N9PE06_9FLAO|nr:ankyrin repeat domain-containing protein [Flavobacterium columnare]RVU91845.1 ankyrin repeat domain-containing protein [Flavobacterium columnare]SPE78565.1 Ankyrin repeats (3 copies) [Flavobacterium columnare]